MTDANKEAPAARGAGEIDRVIAALEIPYPHAKWDGDCRGSHIQARKDAKDLILRLSAQPQAREVTK